MDENQLVGWTLEAIKNGAFDFISFKVDAVRKSRNPSNKKLQEFSDWLYPAFDEVVEKFEKTCLEGAERMGLTPDQMPKAKKMIYAKKLVLKSFFIYPWSEIHNSSLSPKDKIDNFDYYLKALKDLEVKPKV